jgi:hypothetical protein
MDRPEGELVRFSPVERRLLADLAAAEGVSVETLIREALTLTPYVPEKRRRHLSVVRLRDGGHTSSRLRL